MSRRSAKSRLVDFALYVIIGMAVVAFAAVYAIYAVRVGGKGELPLKWIGLVGETAVLFGYGVRAMRPYWRNGRFWAGFLGFLTAHSVVYTLVLLRVEQFPLLWFVFIGYLEWVALAYVLDVLLRQRVPDNRGRCHKAS